MSDNRSIITILGIPEEFGTFLLIFSFILLVAPYLTGQDFGIFKVPSFRDSTAKQLKFWGPVCFLCSFLLFFPFIPPSRKITNNESQHGAPTTNNQPNEIPVNDNGIIAYYPFTGNANDISGKTNHGTVNGAYLTMDRHGNSNSAYGFNGQDDSIQVRHNPSLDITQQISLAAWVYPTSQKTQEIVRKGAGVYGPDAAPYSLSLAGTGEIVFSLRPYLQFAQVRKTDYPLNKWFFVVGTYDGTKMKLYVNGKLENSRPISGILQKNSSPLLIGTRLKLPADTFHGKIDELHIYNRALSEAEIITLYKE